MPEPEGCRNGWPGSETAHFKKFYKSCGRLEKEAFEEPPALELGRYPGWITGLAWSPNSKSIAGITAPGMGYNLASLFRFKNITGFASHLIIWSFSTQQEIRREMAHSGWGDTVDWSKEGHWIATGGLDKVVRVWNTQTWQSAKLELHQARVLQVRFHPAESIIASVDNAGGVLLWDYIHGKVVGQYIIESGKQATSIAWLEQGQKLAVGSADGSINLLDRSNQTLTRELRLAGQEEWIWSITLSPCNGLIASRGQANTIKIWQLNYPGPIKELKGLKKTINCLEWSPAGHLLAAAGDDGIITIWDTATWQVKHTLKFNQHSPLWHKLPYVKDLNYHRSIRTVRWSPDGRSLAASDNAGRVLVWKIT
ncbi:MAG: metallophosphoesterase [Chloroflexi bacterium]|nr:metallophosphoesterase [Chloroflexota bacterium]